MESLALARLSPGPLAAQLAICLGYVHSRVAGATPVSLAFIHPPVAEDLSYTLPMLTTPQLDLFADLVGVELDPAAGLIAGLVQDCSGAQAAGVSVAATPPGEKQVYVAGLVPAPAATETDATGVTGIFNVPAGDVSATSSLPEKVWVMKVVTSRSKRYGPAPDTTSVEVVTATPDGIVTGVDWVKVAVDGLHPAGVAGTAACAAAGLKRERTRSGNTK